MSILTGPSPVAIALAWAIRNRMLCALGRVPPRRARDPTAGATHFHDHRDDPNWARGMRATALIGRYLFLRAVP